MHLANPAGDDRAEHQTSQTDRALIRRPSPAFQQDLVANSKIEMFDFLPGRATMRESFGNSTLPTHRSAAGADAAETNTPLLSVQDFRSWANLSDRPGSVQVHKLAGQEPRQTRRPSDPPFPGKLHQDTQGNLSVIQPTSNNVDKGRSSSTCGFVAKTNIDCLPRFIPDLERFGSEKSL